MPWRVVVADAELSYAGLRLLRNAIEEQLRNAFDHADEADLLAHVERKLQTFFADALLAAERPGEVEGAELTDEELTMTRYGLVVLFELRRSPGDDQLVFARGRPVH